jgi:cytochrome c-type biogenesis protein CcmE
MIMIGAAGVTLILAAALVLTALSQRITYFYGPSDLVALDVPPAGAIRLGGLVEDGTVVRGQGLRVRFSITDGAASVPVVYDGTLPDLFRERQGVVTEGTMGHDGVFVAREVLAKHDETYMPREVVEALQRSGEWRGPAPSEPEGESSTP